MKSTESNEPIIYKCEKKKKSEEDSSYHGIGLQSQSTNLVRNSSQLIDDQLSIGSQVVQLKRNSREQVNVLLELLQVPNKELRKVFPTSKGEGKSTTKKKSINSIARTSSCCWI
jgi:hypothetical protein